MPWSKLYDCRYRTVVLWRMVVPHIAHAQTQTVYAIRLNIIAHAQTTKRFTAQHQHIWLVLTHNVGLFNVIFNNVVNGLNVNIWGLS